MYAILRFDRAFNVLTRSQIRLLQDLYGPAHYWWVWRGEEDAVDLVTLYQYLPVPFCLPRWRVATIITIVGEKRGPYVFINQFHVTFLFSIEYSEYRKCVESPAKSAISN